MKRAAVVAFALAGVVAATAAPSFAQSPPPLPALSQEQVLNLDNEMERYRAEVEARVARTEMRREEADRLLEWRRWQLARQIAGLVPPEPREVIVRHEYAPPPVGYGYDYGWPYYPGRYAYAPYWYGPRISVCAGGYGRHSFGSLCF